MWVVCNPLARGKMQTPSACGNATEAARPSAHVVTCDAVRRCHVARLLSTRQRGPYGDAPHASATRTMDTVDTIPCSAAEGKSMLVCAYLDLPCRLPFTFCPRRAARWRRWTTARRWRLTPAPPTPSSSCRRRTHSAETRCRWWAAVVCSAGAFVDERGAPATHRPAESLPATAKRSRVVTRISKCLYFVILCPNGPACTHRLLLGPMVLSPIPVFMQPR